jgi:hypothetical protein
MLGDSKSSSSDTPFQAKKKLPRAALGRRLREFQGNDYG